MTNQTTVDNKNYCCRYCSTTSSNEEDFRDHIDLDHDLDADTLSSWYYDGLHPEPSSDFED